MGRLKRWGCWMREGVRPFLVSGFIFGQAATFALTNHHWVPFGVILVAFIVILVVSRGEG